MKIPKVISKLITNKYVLYLVAIITFLNITGYMMMGNINAVIFFILFAFIITFFSKNMILILLVPLILTNFLQIGMKVKESFESSNSESKNKSKDKSHSPPIIPLEHEEETQENKEDFENRQPLEYSNIDKKKKDSTTRLDHGATIENAYDTLNKIIGGSGFTKMTEDTKRLMEQQQKLAQSMEQFGPMIEGIKPFLEKAESFLSNMDIKGITEMANKTKV
jgi:hypothetical protein